MAPGLDAIANIATNVSSVNTSVLTEGLQTANIGTVTSTLTPLMLTTAAIVVYSLFVFKFYRFLAERDILKLKLHKKETGHEGFLKKVFTTFFYLLENAIMVPVLVFFWFVVLSAALLLLSKNSPDQVMLIAMAIIAGVRITSYYNEDLSRDLAKMIPFALLGIVIIDVGYLSTSGMMESVRQLPKFLDKALFYLIFVAVIELVLRIIVLFRHAIMPDESKGKIMVQEPPKE